jgi:hypothetical protein
MCQLLYVASVEAIEESELLSDATEMLNEHTHANVRDALPEARYLYSLGGCQCYFVYHTEEDMDRAEAEHSGFREYLEGRNAYIPQVVEFLERQRAHTPLWLFSVWERDENLPNLNRWTCPPTYFLRQDFRLPQERSVIEILLDGEPELTFISGNNLEPLTVCRIPDAERPDRQRGSRSSRTSSSTGEATQ